MAKRIAVLPIIALTALLGAGCEDDDDIVDLDEECEDVSGSFTATNFMITGTDDTTLEADLLANGGEFTAEFVTATFTTSHTAETGATAIVRTGTWELEGDGIVLGTQPLFVGAETGGQEFDECELSDDGDLLVLTDNEATFDFDDDTVREDARIEITLERD